MVAQVRLARQTANIVANVAAAIRMFDVRSPVISTFLKNLLSSTITGLYVIGALFGCSKGDASENLIREVAKMEGEDPKVAVALESANKEFYENRPTEDLFTNVVNATKSPNEKTRIEAFKTLATLRATTFHGRAIREIDRMQQDTSEEVRDQYVWVSYLAEHPEWDSIYQNSILSKRPEAVRLAQQAKQYGSRKPKRKTYSP